MQGKIYNRDPFLTKVANQLGKSQVAKKPEKSEWKYHPEKHILEDVTQDELVEILKEQCKSIHTQFVTANKDDLKQTIKKMVDEYGGGPIVAWKDDQFQKFGLSSLLNEEWPNENVEVHIWDPSVKGENIERAEKANVGIAISDLTLAESATIILLSDKHRGRTVSFLPTTSVIIVPKSTIVPRLTQATRFLSEKVRRGELLPSCINLISGPSYSADIEMMLVLGVHGPVKVSYIIVEDL
ncbi:LutC/YkgG family protein [Bacillus massilinigeriensis]|uniref:LutC/YkgG family protein n=1 Tax=Bacillus massilionigeriensis TaxID=1805475 RepID=UPI00096B2CB0|nr:lactate utilization protein C [Bacillus massilionigeriensis]